MTTCWIRGSSGARGALVLLVQPEHDDREMYAEYLSHMGLNPLCVREADAALRLSARADIVVTGLRLPGAVDGYALIHKLRCRQLTRHIPIVVLTVCAWSTEEARARRAGCDEFLTKPCLPHVLLREIRRWLAKSRRHVGTTQCAPVVRPGRPGRQSRRSRASS